MLENELLKIFLIWFGTHRVWTVGLVVMLGKEWGVNSYLCNLGKDSCLYLWRISDGCICVAFFIQHMQNNDDIPAFYSLYGSQWVWLLCFIDCYAILPLHFHFFKNIVPFCFHSRLSYMPLKERSAVSCVLKNVGVKLRGILSKCKASRITTHFID